MILARRAIRRVLVGASSCAALTLAGCTAPAEPGLSPAPTLATSPAATPTTTSPDEQALRDLWARYWVAAVTAYAGPDPDPSLWQGFTSEEVAAAEVALVTQYADNSTRYVGTPRTVELEVSIEGSDARLTGCVDMSEWVIRTPEGELERDRAVYPRILVVRSVDGAWIVVDDDPSVEGVTC